MNENMPEEQIPQSEALERARRAEQALASQVAARFLANRAQLVAAAEKAPGSIVRFRLRPVLAAAATLAMGAGIGLALWNQNGTAPATYVAHRAIITDSGVNRMPAAKTLEATIAQAKTGGTVELRAGTFATALTVRKPVRLVAVDGAVRIGLDAGLKTELDTTQNAS